ncbi:MULTISPECIES: hypothetical protein [unclassified Marinobacter]|jgi:hypothetical protein|uniref:hypothetical protein n=1 Tax=unclassified Marinobacter TaxID=83889 RepID=UPI00200E8258|nr:MULTISPECIES: hypothetical protein [unclassified Marinobacter]MCL1476762.1 hypothetical protein [Marinobacter sp.]MCL1488077.1 hypothetical protein [Marinobacter sp.]UQG57288.1 hypothetical protein MIH16_06500 [Marinobacter sp. M4C]UQG66092.1 hypothetical protein MIH17_06500 [Marinobacter sp. M2C]UQG70372.1 hypothetical protein MIH19_06495 [Marinobacter sp. M1C]
MKLLGSLAFVLSNIVLPAAVGFGAWKGLQFIADPRLTATTMVALSGTLIGFTMTAISLLVSTADRPFIANLRKTGHYNRLVSEILLTATLWLAVAVTALTAHFLTGDWQRLVAAVATGLLTLSFVHFVSAGRKFKIILTKLSAK